MKIIIRNRNKNIEVSNITSKEEMVWIQPEQFEQITTDAGTMATEFMRKHPQIHEVKFSVLPQMDDEEDEEQFNASGAVERHPRVIIIGEDKLQERLDEYAAQYPDDHWTMEQMKEHFATDEQAIEGVTDGNSVSMQNPDLCHWFKYVCITPDVTVVEYQGTYKG